MEICDFLNNWKRMCNLMTEMNGCEDCPIVRNTHGARCGDMPGEMQDAESIAREVEKWAAEHPEPVYPTWYEWLTSIGAVMRKVKPDVASNLIETGLLDPIPAEIAQKLGIEPKEGV